MQLLVLRCATLPNSMAGMLPSWHGPLPEQTVRQRVRIGCRKEDTSQDLPRLISMHAQHLEQQKPPASRTLDAQQTPCASTALAGPSQSPQASSAPLAQHSALLSSVAPCNSSACVLEP